MPLMALNLLAATTAASIYALWSARWWRRGARTLAVLNALVGLAAAGVAVAYASMILGGRVEAAQLGLRALVAAALLLPALTRLAELRRDEQREEVARCVQRRLLGDSGPRGGD